MSSGGSSGPRGAGGGGGGAGGAGGGSSSKGVASSERQGDGSLTVTPDSPADAEWRARRGPLDGVGEISGPWGEEDSTGSCPETRPATVARRVAPRARRRDGRRKSMSRLAFRRFFRVSRVLTRRFAPIRADPKRRLASRRRKNAAPSGRRLTRPPPCVPLRRPATDGPVRQVHVEDRELLGDLQARASKQRVRGRRHEVVRNEQHRRRACIRRPPSGFAENHEKRASSLRRVSLPR